MTRTKKNLLITAFAVLFTLLAGFVLLGANNRTVSAAENYVTLYTPGDATVTSSGFNSYGTASNTHYHATNNVLRINHTGYGRGYGLANYMDIVLTRQAGFTGFAGYAVWMELPASTDAYSVTIMIGGYAHIENATYAYLDQREAGGDTYRYTEESGMLWKRIMNKNGFYGWIMIPKEAYAEEISIANKNITVSVMIECEGNYVRTGSFSFDIGKIVAYSDAQAFAKEISADFGKKYVGNHATLAMKQGASVRYSTENGYGGIRFAYSMSKTDYTALLADVGEGKLYKDITFGLVIAPTVGYTDTYVFNVKTLFGYGSLSGVKRYTWAGEGAADCATIINLTKKRLANDTADGSLMTFYGAMTDILEANLARQFTAQGYIKFQYNSDDSYAYTMVTPYGNDIANNQRSVTHVSQALVAAGKGTSAQRAWVTTNYITPVVESGVTTTYRTNHILINSEKKTKVYDSVVSGSVAVNAAVSATPLTIGGASYDSGKSTASGYAYANGKLELNLYYNVYTMVDFEDSSVTGKPDDASCYESYGITTDEHYSKGTKSLEITPHASDGTWQKMFLADGSGNYLTYNLTNITAITFWIKYTGETTLPDGTDSVLAMVITNSTGTSVVQEKDVENLMPGVWIRYTLTLDHSDNTKLTSVRIGFTNMGGTYTHRESFYVDKIQFVP